MGVKHKKTRKQKIIADLRHSVYTLENKFSTFSPQSVRSQENQHSFEIDKNPYSYSYVMRDVLKTGLLTFSILASEIILFFLLKNQVIAVPRISY